MFSAPALGTLRLPTRDDSCRITHYLSSPLGDSLNCSPFRRFAWVCYFACRRLLELFPVREIRVGLLLRLSATPRTVPRSGDSRGFVTSPVGDSSNCSPFGRFAWVRYFACRRLLELFPVREIRVGLLLRLSATPRTVPRSGDSRGFVASPVGDSSLSLEQETCHIRSNLRSNRNSVNPRILRVPPPPTLHLVFGVGRALRWLGPQPPNHPRCVTLRPREPPQRIGDAAG